MRELIKDRSATTIAVSEGGYYFYTAMPAVFPLKSDNVAVQLESALTTPADFFVMGFERPLLRDSRDSAIHQVESAGNVPFYETVQPSTDDFRQDDSISRIFLPI